MEKNKFSLEEEKVLDFWQKNDIFKKSVDIRPQNDRYVLYDGPPFATGLPHYGHILSSVIKDLVPRYFTMKGKKVERRWGWDCHGLPIETLVEKELQISGKKEIEERGIELFNKTARSMVLGYTEQWKQMVDRIGRWVDFDNSYKTMDTTYMESVWWALKQLWEKDLVYEGRKVLLYCTRCETPVSNAEIQMDNSYKDVTEETLVVKFRLKPNQSFGKSYKTGESAYILAWTTTPWTLPGNVALAIGAEIEYSAVRINGVKELYIVASALVKNVFKDKKIEVVHDDIKGRQLVNLEYEPLYKIEAVTNSGKKAWYVADADFVSTEEGTGVVHTAVIYGENDFNLGMKIDLPQVPLLNQSGHFNEDAPRFIKGMQFKKAEQGIKEDLEKRNLIFSRFSYTHSYPFCWRCESPLIYNAISAWFINIQKNKKRLIELNEKINWYPENIKHGRFLHIIETAPDWNISRNRYWATPLPFWKCSQCKKTECIGSVDELRERSTNFAEVYPELEKKICAKSQDGKYAIKNSDDIDLHRPYIDDIKIKCECGQRMQRVPEVIDCWVESAAMPFAMLHYPFENVENFEKNFPGQFIGEYIAQTRAWFYYMHTLSTLLFDSISFENVVATGTILNQKGEKLSKSKKNYPDPWLTVDSVGSDSLRFYLMNSVVMQADNLFFNETDLKDTYNKVTNIVYNIGTFLELYFNNSADKEINYDTLGVLDRWILSRITNTIKETELWLDKYNTVKATREIKTFLDDFSTWWLRRSRDRFKLRNTKEAETALAVMDYLLKNLVKIMAPITPFVSEHIWQKIKGKSEEESVHLTSWPEYEPKYMNEEIEDNMRVAREIVEQGHALRAKHSIRVRQTIGKIFWSYKFTSDEDQYRDLILEELNVEKFSQINEIKNPVESSKNKLKVVIDIEIDDRLKKLGDLREVVRMVQQIRKKKGYKQGEKVQAAYLGENELTNKFIDEIAGEICSQASLGGFAKTQDDLSKYPSVILSSGKLFLKIK